MYDLPYHKEPDHEVIRSFIEEFPFALLTGSDQNGRPVATQVPLLLAQENGQWTLRGHMMRDTDHYRAFENNGNVLAVFCGPHTYVSGTWYSNPHTPSTWNYMSVHARGTIRFLDGEALEETLRETSLHFEANGEGSPTTYDNLPASLTQGLLKMIVAFSIDVIDLDTVFKLSQDRDQASYLNIIEQLREQDGHGRRIAEEMEKRLSTLFSSGSGK